MSNKQQFNHNINKAQRQRIAENDIKTQISNSPGFSKIAENDLHIQIMSDRLKYNYDNLIDYWFNSIRKWHTHSKRNC